jgi:hypothetical protein
MEADAGALGRRSLASTPPTLIMLVFLIGQEKFGDYRRLPTLCEQRNIYERDF